MYKSSDALFFSCCLKIFLACTDAFFSSVLVHTDALKTLSTEHIAFFSPSECPSAKRVFPGFPEGMGCMDCFGGDDSVELLWPICYRR